MSENALEQLYVPLPPVQTDSFVPPCEVEQVRVRGPRVTWSHEELMTGDQPLDSEPGDFIGQTDIQKNREQRRRAMRLEMLEMLYTE